ncbi:DsbA family protein [Actibacterium sp. 188UL27-1]|uniref:DsbA family protein n=1 Tax=Actibacterium sp. 188UL27-1 TaxID=2786961 RepID=UPI00195DF2A4|nr:DsbA family protein [Actibacterium sp. 188UL27-1]MBM7070157.1 DsbA family protein [Actibacterium sp. 188UL27-1]
MNRRTLLMTASAAAVGSAGLYWFSSASNTGTLIPPAQAQSSEASEIDTSDIVEMTMGDPEAPVTVVEYASYTCPHCATFHKETFKKLKTEFIDTGKVHFIYREVYFDRPGLWASMVARCGGPVRYFGINELLYNQQREWTSGDSSAVVANLRKIGRTAGLDDAMLDACLQDAGKAEALYANYQKNMEADGIRSTPSFLINGNLISGNTSFSEFSRLIEAELPS